ncbi:Reverse transcriptase domain [Trinorchestia longiramus]|nr:Reverse transcriptase domain [Trinorchestia longiramus]
MTLPFSVLLATAGSPRKKSHSYVLPVISGTTIAALASVKLLITPLPDIVCPTLVNPKSLPHGEPKTHHPAQPIVHLPPLPQALSSSVTSHTHSITNPPPPHSFPILQYNCNGLQHCSSELTHFMSTHSVVIAAIQETKLFPSLKPNLFPSHSFVRRDRPPGWRAGGGGAFLIHHSIPYSLLPSDHLFPDRSFPLITDDQIREAIKKSSTSTAAGPDNLTILYIRHLVPSRITYLTNTYNHFLSHATIPSICKTAIIITIPKPGKPPSFSSSYHLISLLCPAVKALKRLLLPHLTVAIPLPESQHGFRLLHSTTYALVPVSHTKAAGFNHHHPPLRTTNMAIDFFKTFDTVSHPQLFSPLPLNPHSPLAGLLPQGQISQMLLQPPPLLLQTRPSGRPPGFRHISSTLQPICLRLPFHCISHHLIR